MEGLGVVVLEIADISGGVVFTSGVIDVVCGGARGASTGAIGGDGGGFGV